MAWATGEDDLNQALPTVIIIEDNEVIRMTLRSLIRRSRYQVIGQASNGEIGLEMVRRLQPDLLCLDLVLPGIDGVMVLRTLRQELPELRVVVISGQTDRATIEELVNYSADEVVVKPFTEARLFSALEKALAGRGRALQGRRAEKGEVQAGGAQTDPSPNDETHDASGQGESRDPE